MRIQQQVMHLTTVVALAFSALIGCAATPPAQAVAAQPAATRPTTKPAIDRFEKTIVAFETKDKAAMPAPGGTVFVGSSTFAQWKLIEDDFKDFHAINRGFGGSISPEVLYYMDRIVLPYKPATIVFYCGENDIAGGRSADQVLADFQTFVQRVHTPLPRTRIFYLSIKYSPVRPKWHAEFKRANHLIRQFTSQTPNTGYIDIASALLDPQGKTREDLFLKDRLHMNRQGQEVCIPVIRKALAAIQE